MNELNADVPLPDGPEAPSIARTALRSVLQGWAFTDRDWLYDATLVVSELVSNAVRHGRGGARLRVHAVGDQVRLGVADNSAQLPRRRHDDEPAESGWGITFVDAFSAGWQAEVKGNGKDVWVRLATYPGSDLSPPA